MIELKGLTKTYETKDGPTTVLDDISLTVPPGEITAVVGPSGAGKSTLSKMIALLERPTSGTVTVDGVDLSRLRGKKLRASRQRIGTIFQSGALFQRLTAAQNITLPLDFLGVRQDQKLDRVARLLDRVGLSDRANHYPAQLSGGQQQRVGIARALALRPSVLLADEATSGLDPQTTTSILELIKELRSDLGITVVMITHEMDVVRTLADSVARLSAGKIVEHGRVADLSADPSSALGRELVPVPTADTRPDNTDLYHLLLSGPKVPTDWAARAGQSLGTPVHVLSASLETRGGRYTGRAQVAINHSDPNNVGTVLSGLGISSEHIGPSYQPIPDSSAEVTR